MDSDLIKILHIVNEYFKIHHNHLDFKRFNTVKNNWTKYSNKVVLFNCDLREYIIEDYLAIICSGCKVILIDSKYSEDVLERLKVKFNSVEFTIIPSIITSKTNFPLNECAQLISTSGTTGIGKFVMQSYKNIICNAKNISKYITLDSSSKTLIDLPLNLAYGNSVLWLSLTTKAKIFICHNNWLTKEYVEFINLNKIDLINGTPFLWKNRLKYKWLNSLTHFPLYITQAGGFLDHEIKKEIFSYLPKNTNFLIMYGQTEATSRISWYKYRPENVSNRIGDIVSNGKVEINKNNELIFSGDNVALGYIYDLNNFKLFEGIINTGDIVTKSKNGDILITGRNRHLKKINGSRLDMNDLQVELRTRLGFNTFVTSDEDKFIIALDGKQTEIDLYKKIIADIFKNLGFLKISFKLIFIEKEFEKNLKGNINWNAYI